MPKTTVKRAIYAAIGLALFGTAAEAQTPEQFYKGRQVDMFIG